jgi:hypothetical protein
MSPVQSARTRPTMRALAVATTLVALLASASVAASTSVSAATSAVDLIMSLNDGGVVVCSVARSGNEFDAQRHLDFDSAQHRHFGELGRHSDCVLGQRDQRRLVAQFGVGLELRRHRPPGADVHQRCRRA